MVMNIMVMNIKMTVLKDVGATISPHDAWLIMRGLKILPIRMEHNCSNAEKIAEFLENNAKVTQVYYPGLKSHPGYRFIGSQMKAAVGVIAFEIDSDLVGGSDFINRMQLFSIALSLGDAESLIQHPASMTHLPYTQEERLAAGISDSLIRISVCLENVDDLIADLTQSLVLI
ncbi:MAG: methionine-gamma-lyase [Psychroserpens sp.]|jgi:methionine-gamma-lyase